MRLQFVAAFASISIWQWAFVHGFVPALTISTTGSPAHTRASTKACVPLKLNLFDELFSNTSKTSNQKQYPKVCAPPDFVPPEPRPLTLTSSADLGAFLTASAGLALRLGTGAFVLGWKLDSLSASDVNADGTKQYSLKLGPLRIRDSSSVLDQADQPEQMLVLYDNDSSPRCKRVRELLNLLDITYEARPSFDIAQEPRLYDPNKDETIRDDNQIIEYLLGTYGPPPSTFDRKALWPIEFQAFSLATSQLAASLRGKPGTTKQANARPDNEEMQPLELWGYECSPFVKPVREKLCNLGLPHRIVSCARGSKNRDRMVEKTGRFQVPYIVDMNTGVEMYESPEIVQYLEDVYTVKNE